MSDSIDPPIDSLPLEETYASGEISPEVLQASEDAQIFISYIAWQDNIEFDEDLLQVLIESRLLIQEGKWTPEAELRFWLNFDKLAELAAPVTIESIKATLPGLGKDNGGVFLKKTDAAKAVRRYRLWAIVSLFFLLVCQIYWFIGTDLTTNLNDIFRKRTQVDEQIDQMKSVAAAEGATISLDNRTLPQLEKESKVLNQLLDANYELLRDWVFFQTFSANLTEYNTERYKKLEQDIQDRLNTKVTQADLDQGIITQKIETPLTQAEIDQEIRALHLQKEFDKARNKFFLYQLSAEFTLRALQSYLLPLLYGLLGAMTYVLRTLSTEIKTVTYSAHSETRFRLRLSLGSLAGMVIGWFFTPDASTGLASLGPMTVAFLTGYNVDILFSLMDKLVNSITTSIQGSGKSQETQKPQKAKKPAPVSDESPDSSSLPVLPEKTA